MLVDGLMLLVLPYPLPLVIITLSVVSAFRAQECFKRTNMGNPMVPNVTLDELKCTNCNRYISVGPVRRIPRGYLCNRCPTNGDERLTVVMYEKLPQHNLLNAIRQFHPEKKWWRLRRDHAVSLGILWKLKMAGMFLYYVDTAMT